MAEVASLGAIAKEAHTNYVNGRKQEVEEMLNKDHVDQNDLVKFLEALGISAWEVAAQAVYTVAVQQCMERMQQAITGYTAQVAVDLTEKFKAAGEKVE